MKVAEIDQLEKELTWIFVHVRWSNPAARREAAVQTIRDLRALRAKAEEGLSKEQARAEGFVCSWCGKDLPLATTGRRRFCGEVCKKRYQRQPPREQTGESQTAKIVVAER